ncbi:hypothetical protein [uncultured Parolsenella sp.]|uniref:hypothetical protein n=1 Tax=uncultured Parolsenella sp. TaxID=2083008 RepID=UPI0025FEC0DC|nr:hypothetical protein [uncultured Parolsenella sp.]
MLITRRAFLLSAAAAAFSLAACRKREVSWSAEADDSLDYLSREGADGAPAILTGDAWAPREGFIQLQLSGASIPGQKIESVSEKDGTLTVTLEVQDGPQTMDLIITEWRLTPEDAARVSSVERVMIDYGGGDVREAERAD